MRIYIELRDWWVGYYRGDAHHYVCLLPCLVIRWRRRDVRAAMARLRDARPGWVARPPGLGFVDLDTTSWDEALEKARARAAAWGHSPQPVELGGPPEPFQEAVPRYLVECAECGGVIAQHQFRPDGHKWVEPAGWRISTFVQAEGARIVVDYGDGSDSSYPVNEPLTIGELVEDHDGTWPHKAVGVPAAASTDEPRCNCDGARYYSAEVNKTRHPFIVNANCPVHRPAASDPAEPTEQEQRARLVEKAAAWAEDWNPPPADSDKLSQVRKLAEKWTSVFGTHAGPQRGWPSYYAAGQELLEVLDKP